MIFFQGSFTRLSDSPRLFGGQHTEGQIPVKTHYPHHVKWLRSKPIPNIPQTACLSKDIPNAQRAVDRSLHALNIAHPNIDYTTTTISPANILFYPKSQKTQHEQQQPKKTPHAEFISYSPGRCHMTCLYCKKTSPCRKRDS